MTSGFTLIEILVALGISAILFSTSAFITVDAYKSTLYEREFNFFLSLLQKTRSEAVNNINDQSHTFKITPDNYFIDAEEYQRNAQIQINGPTEITFENLNGNVASLATFDLSDGIRTKEILVEESGKMDW